MTNEQYQATQDKLVIIYQQLSLANLDLVGFLERLGEADTLGPIVDPTMWIAVRSKLEWVRGMAEALQPAVRWIRKSKEALGK